MRITGFLLLCWFLLASPMLVLVLVFLPWFVAFVGVAPGLMLAGQRFLEWVEKRITGLKVTAEASASIFMQKVIITIVMCGLVDMVVFIRWFTRPGMWGALVREAAREAWRAVGVGGVCLEGWGSVCVRAGDWEVACGRTFGLMCR